MATWLGTAWSYITGDRSAKLSGAPEDMASRAAIHWGGRSETAGERVTQGSTLGLSAAYACVHLKSELVGSMGCGVFSKSPSGGRRAEDGHWLYELLHEQPNADQTPSEFWAGQVAALDLWGNAYAEKEQLGKRVTALTPLRPDQTTMIRRDGKRIYQFHDRGKIEELPADKVFHLRGMTLGGDCGLSPVEIGRRSLGTAMAANRRAAVGFHRGMRNSGFMETGEARLAPEQREDMVKIFDRFTGDAAEGRVMPLERGFKFVPLDFKPADFQLLESRRWDVEEVCRWFAMLPVLIGHAAQGQTMWGSGIEQLLLGWQTLRLNPLLRKIEQAAKLQLLPLAERKNVYPEFNREAVMATDSAGRAALYSAFGQNGVMDRNEMRSRENLDHRPGGDFLTVQSNLVRLDQLGTVNSAGSSEQQLRAALMGMLGVNEGNLEALIEAKVRSMMGHNGAPSLEA